MFRVAIGNHRIQSVQCHEDGTGTVMMKVRPSGQRRYRTISLTVEEFICRFLQHVLPTGFQKVRHFGFMHKRSKVNPTWLSMLVTVTLNLVYVLIVTPVQVPIKRVMSCPDCGGDLECLGFVKGDASSMPTLNSS